MTGILGEYVGRIYEEIKRRPLYVAAREVNFHDEGASVPRVVRARIEAGDKA
jgi:dolichol-phosphate mannosyltransferase